MDPVMNVDVLVAMKKGTPFLKYGTNGYPHFRQFLLSDDNMKIMWFSKLKRRKNTEIRIEHIREIREGQTTSTFERYEAPELKHQSFSILYKRSFRESAKTLDLIAKDNNEFKIWLNGLKELVRMHQQHTLRPEMDKLVLELHIRAGRRSSVDIRDEKTGENADELAGEVLLDKMDEEKHKALSHKVRSSRRREITLKAGETSKRVAKLRAKLNMPKFLRNTQHSNMVDVLRRCDQSLERVEEWIVDGQLDKCEDWLWRCEVDMDSLVDMMKVCK
jgi:hypothetical protein